MREIVIKPGEAVPLGFRGENDATQILFDVTGWAEEFGEGVFQLLARLPGDEDAYTVPITTSGGYVRWTVTSGDTAITGSGAAQLEYYVGTALAKSCSYLTVVAESLGPSSGIISDAEAWAIGERDGEPVPESDETYHNNSKYYAGEAESSSEAAAASAEAAQETVEGAQAAIDAAKAAAVQDVQAEGTTQIQAVQAAGSQAAQAATGAAERAAQSAEAASTYAQDAETYCGGAENASVVAAHSKSIAMSEAQSAERSATQAAGSATAAAASAAAAQTAAERDVPAAAAAWLSENVDPATGYVLDDSLSIENAAADAKAAGAAVSGVRSMILDDAEALSYALEAGKYVRIANGAVVNSTSYNATGEIPLDGYAWIVYAKMRMRVESTQAAAIAFYDAQHAYLFGYAPTTSAATVGADMTAVEVPNGAAYARFTYYNGNYDVPPLTIFGLHGEKSLPARIDKLERDSYAALGLHTIPQSQGVLNAIKRARQMTDIEWTPAVDLPRACSLGGAYSRVGALAFENVFKAGVTYRGIPYSRSDINAESWGYDTMTVGLDVPFSAFVTAAASPDSVIAKESEYQTGGGSPRSVYFGTICSGLVCYALGIDHLYLTADMPSIPGLASVGALISNGVRFNINNLRLGDLLLKTGFHVSMVTDIISDGGVVTAVEVAEATTGGDVANTQKTGGPVGGVCRRVVWPVEEFFSWWRDYTVYRYANIDAVPYTPDPYVRVGTEGWMIHYDKMPVIPYMGEGFVYKAGSVYSDALVIMAADDFATLRIYKDGTLFAELTVNGQTSIGGGFTAAGQYEAYLCNLSGGNEVNRSVSCHWSVVA